MPSCARYPDVMVIHFRFTVRTHTETVVFARDVDLPAIPAIGDQVDAPQVCGPLVVQAITTTDGAITCEVGHPKEPSIEHQPLGMENIQPELWDLAHAGWRREG